MAAPAIAQPWITLRPTPPAPEHDRDRARFDTRGVNRGTKAGHDAAGDQRGPIERHLPVDLHQAVGM
jgi:hypothetical protein